MPSLVVRTFAASEWRTYRDLRLRALCDSPDAFGATYDRARLLTDDDWRLRLARASTTDDLPLLAETDNGPCGLAWGRVEPSDRNTAYLFQMWVAPDCRGRGAGRMLLERVIAWAQSLGVRSVVLGVTCGNSPAQQLYARAGFLPVGDPEPLRPESELLAQSMELKIAPDIA